MGYSLVLGIVTDSLCVADGARFLFPEFLSHCSLLVKLPHNFFSCNSNECPPPPAAEEREDLLLLNLHTN